MDKHLPEHDDSARQRWGDHENRTRGDLRDGARVRWRRPEHGDERDVGWAGHAHDLRRIAQTIPGGVKVAVSGQNAAFTGVCLDQSGSVTAHGSGNSASWSGSLVCPAVQFTCGPVVMTFQSASATLNGSTMNVQGAGNAAGCGLSKGFTISLAGTKQ